jgi:hypothetical protein
MQPRPIIAEEIFNFGGADRQPRAKRCYGAISAGAPAATPVCFHQRGFTRSSISDDFRNGAEVDKTTR